MPLFTTYDRERFSEIRARMQQRETVPEIDRAWYVSVRPQMKQTTSAYFAAQRNRRNRRKLIA